MNSEFIWCFETPAGALCFYVYVMFSPNILPDLKNLPGTNNILYGTSQKPSRTFCDDNKQKHQLVLRRTSWCFEFLSPSYVFTKYFTRLIKLHKEKTITCMGPVVTSQTHSRTFYSDNKQKHQLVLRRTNWCFVFLSPSHVFTKYFARLIKVHKEQTITCMGPVVTSQIHSRTFYSDN